MCKGLRLMKGWFGERGVKRLHQNIQTVARHSRALESRTSRNVLNYLSQDRNVSGTNHRKVKTNRRPGNENCSSRRIIEFSPPVTGASQRFTFTVMVSRFCLITVARCLVPARFFDDSAVVVPAIQFRWCKGERDLGVLMLLAYVAKMEYSFSFFFSFLSICVIWWL